MTVHQITGLAEKANLPGEIIKDIQKEAAWNPIAKTALQTSAPRVAAKLLNTTGVSAEHQDALVLGSAIGSILAGHVLLIRRMRELIKKANPPTEEPAKVEDKKA